MQLPTRLQAQREREKHWSALALSAGANSARRDLILVVQAVDATRISDWLGPGSISDRLASIVDALRAQHLVVSAVLWQQGEADAREGTSKEAYAAALTMLIHRLRDQGISGPVLLARSTRCRKAGSEDVRGAVARVAQKEPDVFLGPDTDTLGDKFRTDGCHFNDAGRQRAADAWLGVLQQRGVINAN
jgi:lysophospholipase L1-like esterase